MNIIKKMRKKGISPVIASIILIAITIAVAIAVAGWVFGLFGAYVGGGGVEIVYGPSTYIKVADDFSFKFHNGGSSIVSIVAVDFGVLITTPSMTPGTGTFNSLTLAANSDTTITKGSGFTAWNVDPVQGQTYTVTFTLSDGTVMPVVLTAIA